MVADNPEKISISSRDDSRLLLCTELKGCTGRLQFMSIKSQEGRKSQKLLHSTIIYACCKDDVLYTGDKRHRIKLFRSCWIYMKPPNDRVTILALIQQWFFSFGSVYVPKIHAKCSSFKWKQAKIAKKLDDNVKHWLDFEKRTPQWLQARGKCLPSLSVDLLLQPASCLAGDWLGICTCCFGLVQIELWLSQLLWQLCSSDGARCRWGSEPCYKKWLLNWPMTS